VKGQPEQLRVRAHSVDSSNKKIEAEASIAILEYKTKTEHDFPLTGTWYVGASGTFHTHHRWVAMEEFALDILQLGSESKSYKTNGVTSGDYVGFGKDVIASADGTVVGAVDQYEDDDAKLKKENETYEQYDQRIMMEQMTSLQKDPNAIAGNYVVIKHADAEFSFYAHLKKGSVKVKKGDVIKRGQSIGSVGNTGSSTEPHLHFQLQDSADPFQARALPIRFRNAVVDMLGFKGRHLQSGWIVTAK
jgi:murein DD-endopeptidase MepM/ murein hydrolase activator NlpD